MDAFQIAENLRIEKHPRDSSDTGVASVIPRSRHATPITSTVREDHNSVFLLHTPKGANDEFTSITGFPQNLVFRPNHYTYN